MHDENVNLVNGSETSSKSDEEQGKVVEPNVKKPISPSPTAPRQQGILKKSSPVSYKSSK